MSRAEETAKHADKMRDLLGLILTRLDTVASERGQDAVFPCAAFRNDIRKTLGATLQLTGRMSFHQVLSGWIATDGELLEACEAALPLMEESVTPSDYADEIHPDVTRAYCLLRNAIARAHGESADQFTPPYVPERLAEELREATGPAREVEAR